MLVSRLRLRNFQKTGLAVAFYPTIDPAGAKALPRLNDRARRSAFSGPWLVSLPFVGLSHHLMTDAMSFQS